MDTEELEEEILASSDSPLLGYEGGDPAQDAIGYTSSDVGRSGSATSILPDLPELRPTLGASRLGSLASVRPEMDGDPGLTRGASRLGSATSVRPDTAGGAALASVRPDTTGDPGLSRGASRLGSLASVRPDMDGDPGLSRGASRLGSAISVRPDTAGDPDVTRGASRLGSLASVRPDTAGDPGLTRGASRLGSLASVRPDMDGDPGLSRGASRLGSLASVRPDTAGGAALDRGDSRTGSVLGPRPDRDLDRVAAAPVPAAADSPPPDRGHLVRPDTGTPSSQAGGRPPLSSRPGSETPAARVARISTARVRAVPPTSDGKSSQKSGLKSESLKSPLVEVAEEEFEFQGENVWAIAEKMNQARILRGIELTETQSVESTLLFVGSKQSGKSTMIHKFLDRDEEPKRTLGLEYSYGRKAGKSVLKDVCHIWELGGGTTYTPLLETPLAAGRLPTIAIFVVVDLMQPRSMWSTLETMLQTLRDALDAQINSAIGREMKLKERLMAATELRVPSDHQDYDQLRPFPVPLVIIGGRYDVFQDWEPERKKLVCRTLRYLAHVNGASLQFFSFKDSALVKKAKDLMTALAFGGATSGGHLAQDYNKPLLVPAGADSLPVILGLGADTSYNTIRNTFAVQYPQDGQNAAALSEDPAKDLSYREPEVDQLRSQKDQELDRLRRELERRKKWGDEL